MFKFDLYDTVYMVGEDKSSIRQGMVISRKVVECAEWDGRMRELDSPYDKFSKNGNKLGSPCETYEVKVDGYNLTGVFSADKLYNCPSKIAQNFSDEVNKYL